jgi:hypothetical protein
LKKAEGEPLTCKVLKTWATIDPIVTFENGKASRLRSTGAKSTAPRLPRRRSGRYGGRQHVQRSANGCGRADQCLLCSKMRRGIEAIGIVDPVLCSTIPRFARRMRSGIAVPAGRQMSPPTILAAVAISDRPRRSVILKVKAPAPADRTGDATA